MNVRDDARGMVVAARLCGGIDICRTKNVAIKKDALSEIIIRPVRIPRGFMVKYGGIIEVQYSECIQLEVTLGGGTFRPYRKFFSAEPRMQFCGQFDRLPARCRSIFSSIYFRCGADAIIRNLGVYLHYIGRR